MNNPSNQKTVFGSNPYIIINNQGKTMQFDLTQPEHKLGRDHGWADFKIPLNWSIVSGKHCIFKKQGDDYIIIDGDGQKRSSNGIYCQYVLTPYNGFLLENNTQVEIGQNPHNWVTIQYFNPTNVPVTAPDQTSVSLRNGSIEIGRGPMGNNVLKLNSPLVSRRHAIIDRNDQGQVILHDNSTNGVWINGQKVNGLAILYPGVNIRIAGYTFIFQNEELKLQDSGDRIRLDAYNLLLPKRVDNLTVAIEPGQFVALVGGSGAGKSSLMKTLLGIEKPQNGKVYLNGEDLRENYNIYRTQIGYVPQDDILHPDLTVEEVITYAAKMRLPSDISVMDLKTKVNETLTNVEMSHKKTALVKDLSGGQRKRVSIGVELLADPKLFFLDEPTSGLDPGLDKKMMKLLRSIADQGRTVILVTHATANINECDRIAFLGRGGRLCYFGTPNDAFKFFQNNSGDFADIYVKLEAETDHETEIIVKHWESEFQRSPYYQIYVQEHLKQPNSQQNKQPEQAKLSLLQQLILLTQRYAQLILRDRINLGIALLTAPIGILFVLLALKGQAPFIKGDDDKVANLAIKVLLIFSCAGMWVGISTSSQEIVKESAIYLRERLVNLNLFAYLTSKVIVLGIVALLQTLLITGLIIVGFKAPDPAFFDWNTGVFITTFLTIICSMSLGLLISTMVKNSSQANSSLPLVLLPLIIFSGVLFKIEGSAKIIYWLMLSRWSVGAYGILIQFNDLIPKPIEIPGRDPIIILEKSNVYNATWDNLNLNWGMLLLLTIIYLGTSYFLQKRKDLF
jgi:ABC transport system ATP-binding/permease protein